MPCRGQARAPEAATLTPTTFPQAAQTQRLKQSGFDKGLEQSLQWGLIPCQVEAPGGIWPHCLSLWWPS